MPSQEITSPADVRALLPAGDARAGRAAVTLVADARYLTVLCCALVSMAESARDRVEVFVLTVDVPAERRRLVESHFAGSTLDLQILDISELHSAAGLDRRRTLRADISPAAFARFFAPTLIDREVILYLDCDMLVAGDVRGLLALCPEVLAACEAARPIGRKTPLFERTDLARTPYFNSGLMLINRRYWMDNDVHGAFLKALELPEGSFPLGDQDIFNTLFGPSVSILDSRWNFCWPLSYRHPRTVPNIFHFAGRLKPWDPRDLRCPPEIRAWYARLLAELPSALREDIGRACMSPGELAEQRRPAARLRRMAGRLAEPRRAMWNPAHARRTVGARPA